MNDNNSTPKDDSNPSSVNPGSVVPPPPTDLPPTVSFESPAPPSSPLLPPDGNDNPPPPVSPPGDNPPKEDIPSDENLEQKAQEILGSENNSDRNHKGGKGKLYAIAAVVLLLLAIPAGIFLTQQMGIGDIREQASSAGDCDSRGGFAGYGEDCDTGRGELVKVVICNNGDHLAAEPTGRSCGGGAPQPKQCDSGGRKYNPGEKRYDCTGNKASCRGEAGEGIPQICNNDGNWSANPSECTNECQVADKSDCEYREKCTTGDGKSGTRLCSGKKDPQDEFKCKYDAKVSSCQQNPNCTVDPVQSCTFNKNYQAGLLSGKANPDPNCSASGGAYCNDGGNFNVCCYGDGNCYQGQQGKCENLGNGTIKTVQTAQIDEYYCPDQKSPTGSCSSGKTSRGSMGPGTYSVNTNKGCGGYQIDGVGLCGSYVHVACPATPPQPQPPAAGAPSYSSQCLDIKFYDITWKEITNPASVLKAGDVVRIAVSGNTNEPGGLTFARFKVNSGEWEQTDKKESSGKFYVEKTISAGQFKVEAQVFNPTLGWK